MTEVLEIPIEGQVAVVNSVVLPLLKRAGIGVEVRTSQDGMVLTLTFRAPAVAEVSDDRAKTVGTDEPDRAAALWALRERIEEARRGFQPAPPV